MGDFQDQIGAYDDADVQVVALSADGEEGAREMMEEVDVAFPILYGLDVDEMEERIGTYVEKGGDREHLQPAQFILKPDGTVALACYSSGAVGRLGAGEALKKAQGAMEEEGEEKEE